MSRKYTNKLLEMLDEGLISKDFVIGACLNYMSEDDVRDMMWSNEINYVEETEDNEVEE